MENRISEEGERWIEKLPAGTKVYLGEDGKFHPTTDDDPRATHCLCYNLLKDVGTGEMWQVDPRHPIL